MRNRLTNTFAPNYPITSSWLYSPRENKGEIIVSACVIRFCSCFRTDCTCFMHSCCLFVAQNVETLDRQGFLFFVSANRYFSNTQQVSTNHFKQYSTIRFCVLLLVFMITIKRQQTEFTANN